MKDLFIYEHVIIYWYFSYISIVYIIDSYHFFFNITVLINFVTLTCFNYINYNNFVYSFISYLCFIFVTVFFFFSSPAINISST